MMSQPNMTETCILVAEVIGDNPLLDKIGRDETLRAVERSRKRAERSIEAYRGFAVSVDGRRLVAHFPRGENAVLAAFDMRARVKQLPPVSGVALSVHVVVHAGHLDANSNQPDLEAVTLAGRLVIAAPANQILVSDEAVERLPETMRGQMVAEPASAMSVSGYTGALHAFPAGVVPTATSNSAAVPPSVEAFSPTSTSLTMNQAMREAAGQSSQAAFPTGAAHAQPRTTLMLRHNNNNLSVSDNHPVVLAGREEGNDLVIIDRRASRHHARIEWRQNHFVLIDTSTNGTFMVDQAGNEVVLRRGEADMPPRGRIGFGYSPTEVGAEVVFFDIGQK
jgi:adenylate cyclase